MNKRLILLIVLTAFCFCKNGIAQIYRQTIRGRVIDIDSKSPLFGANIILLNSDSLNGTTTDVDGKFRLQNVRIGKRAIKITSIGYEEAVMGNIEVTSAKEVVLTIELREKVYSSEAIEVIAESDKTKANNDMVSVSSRNFQAEEANRYAGSRGDPSRMVSNYAGVSSGNDASNNIVVRGNSPLGVLWRLEGVDIPNPNHFSTQGATGGPVSMLNTNVLGNSDFLTGAFPSEYGNKTAAVFDLKLRNGNNEKTEFTGQVGFNGFELGAEGPISKKDGSSYIINYRYSTLQVFSLLGINFGVSGTPEYQDVSFKVNVPTPKAGIFTLWGVGGLSTISLLDSKQKPSDWSFTSQGQDLIFGSGMGATGLSHTYFFNNKISGKFTLSASATNFGVTIDTLAPSNFANKFRTVDDKSTEANLIANYVLSDKINASHLIKVGATYQTILFNAHSKYYSTQYGHYVNELDVNKSTANLFQSFIEWQYRPTDKITVNSGLHNQYLLLNKTWALEPRIGVKFQLSPKQNLSVGYGMHSQMQPTIYYFYESYLPATNSYYQSNRNLDFSKSQHLILGYDYTFSKGFRFKFETYYQYLYNIPVQRYNSSFSMINEGNSIDGLTLVDSLVNKGTGKNYGLEFTIERFFSKHYYFLSTVTLYKSEYTGSNTIVYHTSYDGGYVYNALVGYELGLGKNKNQSLSLDLKYTQAGGNRYTPIDLQKSQVAGEAVYIDNEAFSNRLKDYARFDFKLTYKLNRKKTSQSIFVSIENVFNRQNILRQDYNPDTKAIQTEYQFGLFPYGGYRIEF